MDIFSICTAAAWDIEFKQHEQETAISDLESGKIIFCPQLSFNIDPSERMLFIPYLINKKTKNSNLVAIQFATRIQVTTKR